VSMPVLPPALIAQLSTLVAQFISDQRARHLPVALPLSTQQKAAMSGFFRPELLDGARLLVLQGERVPNPDFYPTLRNMGFTNLPHQSTMAAITFSDTAVAHVPFNSDLLFHELVHVEQYHQLGLTAFSDLYVRGFLNGGGYEGIPLERNAYLLGARYAEDRCGSFSVADDVATWITEGFLAPVQTSKQGRVVVKLSRFHRMPVWERVRMKRPFLTAMAVIVVVMPVAGRAHAGNLCVAVRF
jgi:hypothetical protein